MAMATGTALAISAAASLVGAGVSAYGSYQQGKSAERAAKFNARVKENEALREEMESREETRRMRDQNKRLLSKQRARIAASGVIEEGSPLSLMAQTAGLMELEALDARRASAVRQSTLRKSAELDIWSGKQAVRAGNISAGASLLQGVGQAAGTYAG